MTECGAIQSVKRGACSQRQSGSRVFNEPAEVLYVSLPGWNRCRYGNDASIETSTKRPDELQPRRKNQERGTARVSRAKPTGYRTRPSIQFPVRDIELVTVADKRISDGVRAVRPAVPQDVGKSRG